MFSSLSPVSLTGAKCHLANDNHYHQLDKSSCCSEVVMQHVMNGWVDRGIKRMHTKLRIPTPRQRPDLKLAFESLESHLVLDVMISRHILQSV